MPEIILAETLLQRLGLTEDVFTFFGSNHEIELHDLKVKAAALNIKKKKPTYPILMPCSN